MPLCVSEPKRKVVFRFEAKHLDPPPTEEELKRDWNATPVDETMIYTPKVPMKWRRVDGRVSLETLKGIAPDATGNQSAVDFVRKQRDEWE